MKHDVFAKWLKVLILGTSIIGIAGIFTIVPWFRSLLIFQYPNLEGLAGYWNIMVILCSLPCFFAMGICWKIADHIQAGNYFCRENGKLFGIFSRMAFADAIIFLICSIFFYINGMNHIGFLTMSLLVTFIGLAIGICTSALSYFTTSAAKLKEDNDLTI